MIAAPMVRAGIYIHIPFCLSRCSYCDFATGLFETGTAERYVRALTKEISIAPEIETEVDTIYLGGGTPSLLTPSQIEHIMAAVFDRFDVVASPEVTMEMNPGSITPETISAFHQLGINRASFGAQTFDDRELKRLGRVHTAADVRSTFRMLVDAGFKNVSFDLIAGLPGQTTESWSRNLDQALALRPEHLSLYLLDLHEGTPLAIQVNNGHLPQPDEDTAAAMYELMIDQTIAAGYEHYEISNFCRPGFESRHNTKYWTGAPYFGFGCSAHSFDGERRRWSNERDAQRYIDLIESSGEALVESTELSTDDLHAESMYLGLRMLRGIELDAHRRRFGCSIRDEFNDDLERLCEAGLVLIDDQRMRLTRTGALLSNEVFALFV